MGFKGEALASMTYVCRVTVTTITNVQLHGCRATSRDGVLENEPKPCAAVKGIQIMIECLFLNMTAGRKTLQNSADDCSKIQDLICRFTIHHINVNLSCKKVCLLSRLCIDEFSFLFHHDPHGAARADIHPVSTSSRIDTVRSMYGLSVAQQSINVEASDDDRLVECGVLKRSIESAYAAALPKASNPFIYWKVKLLLDANIRPKKRDVQGAGRSAALNNLIKHAVLPIGEGGAAHAPICVDVTRDTPLSRKSAMLQNGSKFQHASTNALEQDRYIPQEMIFEILSHLSAQVLDDVMKRVSKGWNRVIHSKNFIHHHVRNSIGGILIQYWFSKLKATYVEMRSGSLEISKLEYEFENLVWTSCNGLVLVPDSKDLCTLRVMNPFTKQGTVLPRIVHIDKQEYSSFGLGCAEASMEYKAVLVCRDENSGLMRRVAVLTIGVDRVWRFIDVQHLFLPTEVIYDNIPFVTRGYVHWIGKTFVLTLNVETEVVCRFSLPHPLEWYGYLQAMDSHLSHIVRTNEFFINVWEMNPQTGEWTRTLCIDLRLVRIKLKDLLSNDVETMIPVGWLKTREVLVFRSRYHKMHCIAAYNVKTEEAQLIELTTNENVWHFKAHVNSLVGRG